MEKSYYEILGVPKHATQEDLTKAKRELSKKYHPDKLPPNQREHGTKMLQQINEAYDILSDTNKRGIYDRFGKDGLSGHMPQSHPFAGFGGFDPFGHMPFNMGSNMRQQHHPEKRSNIIEFPINLTLEEIFNGKHLNNKITRMSPCTDCDITGFADKKNHKCEKCKGNGQCIETVRIGGNMGIKQVVICNKCNGTGSFSEHVKKCKKCNGKKCFQEEYVLDYELEKGILKGTNRIGIIPDQGNYDIDSSKRGDIVLLANIVEHKLFVIKNTYNLEMTMELSLVEALCGTVKKFTFLDGKDTYINITDPINNKDVNIINGYGLPEKFSTYKCGNLYIEFKVVLPHMMTQEHKSKIYSALTGTTYDHNKLHAIPENIHPIEFQHWDSDSDSDNDNLNESDSDEGEGEGPHSGNVQCAQQ